MAEDKNIQKDQSIHIGQCIKAELERQGRSITWLAGEVHCTRENLYKLLRNPWISTDMLFRVSEALSHDFFEEYSKLLSFNCAK
ncbi:MAG: XRE family transcriptional regulator [Bacteroidales bacterium]|nr:XRE family transcriptional regulator [Bacteroidales bacterium]